MIIDQDTHEEKKYGEEGLLLISGKHVFKGYYKNEELTNQSKMTIDGKEYYNTGTLGYIDEDGYFPDEDTLGHIKDLFYIPTTVSNGRKTQLKTYEIPSYVEFVDGLPRIPGSEKIDYPSLEKDAELKLTTGNKVKVK